jgi:hypothetical protein
MSSLLKNPWVIGGGILVLIIVIVSIVLHSTKSAFQPTLITPNEMLNNSQPKSFTPLAASKEIKLSPPDVPEEIGVSMVYPQGEGVSMSKSDSNSFTLDTPGPLLTSYSTPESYGESSLTDPQGTNGANQGSRIIKIKDPGSQIDFKPVDESMSGTTYAKAYTQTSDEIQNGPRLINGSEVLNYTDYFIPEENLKLQTSPGQESSLPNCESTYPNVVKYNGFCITEGDIPYGQVVDNKVNPRLVSRWQSFTGDYSREDALTPIDGLLYPNLNVLTK